MSLDWTAFTAPVSLQQVQTWKLAAKASGARWAGDNTGRIVLVLVLAVPMIAISILVGFASIAGAIGGFGAGNSSGALSGGLALLLSLFSFGLVALMIWACFKVFPSERRWERWLRLDWFARTNRMTFSPLDPKPNYVGAIFSSGESRAAVDHFRSVEGRFFDVGNFRYVVSNGKTSQTITWGFLALNLERKLPNMFLDSIANNSWAFSGLSRLYARDQVLSLEGDFNRYFTLYCPKQYERDALYVFTPDLMALCIDEAAPFDIEIVDDWLFVYSPRAFAMDNPQLLSRLFRIIDLVGAKALRQTNRYQDDRVAAPFPANIVAQPGQRLRRRFPVAVIVVLALTLVLPMVIGAIVLVTAVLGATAGGLVGH
ncbi:MAG: hypothetical protein ABIR17_08925 [Pseudolysinimonas sp.]|uniref:hypothetical protein n=1 Tax=Pseudolysinimonas sp. TaxID=2680009 RepID=UPI0032665E87